MHISFHKEQLKSSMLPLAMIFGALFYKWMGYLTFLSPYLIFAMLFITYCKLNVRDLKPTKSHLLLLCTQLALSAAAYLLLLPLNHTVAEGVFICIFIPTATAAPVVTAMLGGSISFVATYSLICNAVVAIAGPFVLAAIGDNQELGFFQSMLLIMSKVAPLLICPMILALIMRKVTPSLHKAIMSHQQISFYMWAIALFIIVGSCVSFVINHWDESKLTEICLMIVGSLAACLIQYFVGRHIGASINENYKLRNSMPGDSQAPDFRVSAAQSLMQKNTVLGVWIAMAYMNPLASVAPAAYIAWHNVMNSWQLWRHTSRKTKTALNN